MNKGQSRSPRTYFAVCVQHLCQLEDAGSVRPCDFCEYRRGSELLQKRKRFARETLAFRPRHKLGGNSRAMPVGARTIASEDQLVLMPIEKASHELGITIKAVVAEVG